MKGKEIEKSKLCSSLWSLWQATCWPALCKAFGPAQAERVPEHTETDLAVISQI